MWGTHHPERSDRSDLGHPPWALECSLQGAYYAALLAANPPKKRKQEPADPLHIEEPRRFGLARYLEYMERHDGLAEVYDFSGFRDKVNSLAKIRNVLGHGDLSTGLP